MLPALAFRSGNPGVLEASVVDAEDGEELLQDLEPATGVEVACGIMAVIGVAAGDEHAVGAIDKGPQNKEGINASRAGDADNPEVSGLLRARDASRIGAPVGAPVAQESDNPELFAF